MASNSTLTQVKEVFVSPLAVAHTSSLLCMVVMLFLSCIDKKGRRMNGSVSPPFLLKAAMQCNAKKNMIRGSSYSTFR